MPNGEDFEYNEDNEEQGQDELFEQYLEEQEALNESGTFEDIYGFPHDCRCALDWNEGNLGVVSICYLEMCNTALDALSDTRKELAETKGELAALKLENV